MVLLCSSYSASNAQEILTTGNLVDNNWVNGVPQNSLTCWAGGQPGYCGPNPIVRPDGNINFSYGTTDLYQQRAIATALENSGTGLRVNGFNFSFTAKNGNGWDDGRTDYLTAYTRFYGANGSVVQDYNYNLAYKFDWTTFTYNETFLTPYASKDLSNVRYGFVGRDNNFWAGPYGPEINNVSFRLKYSTDPCAVDVTSSPSCPGYLDAITAKLPKPEPVATTTSTATVEAPAVTTTTVVSEPISTSSTSAPVAAVATVTPSANNPQPKVGEVQVSGSQSKTTLSTSQILSIVRSEQSRISGVESSTVQQANEQAASVSQNAQSTAQSVAANAVTSSMSSSSVYQSFAARSSSFSVTNSSLQQQGGAANYSIAPSAGRTVETEAPKTENATDGRSVLTEFMQPRPQLPVENVQQQQASSVNRSVKDNDAAGGVSITAMIKQPMGFETYMNGLVDKPFYPPKEIYKNQKTVDNARAERLLNAKSDQLHQQMVDQQYNLGK